MNSQTIYSHNNFIPSAIAMPRDGSMPAKTSNSRTTQSKSVLDDPPNRPKLVAQAEALARMTLELSVRAVTQHAERLQKALDKVSTRADVAAGFAAAHQDRIEKMGVEIKAVKDHIENLKDHRENQDKDDEQLRRDVATGLASFRSELNDIKRTVASAAVQLDKMPNKAAADAVLAAIKMRAELTGKPGRRHTGTSSRKRHKSMLRRATACASQPIHARIQETIKSTRRWHLDHKTTRLPDAAFTARYLRKQRRRDPLMARYLHRAIQRTARRRRNEEGEEEGHRETSLDEACKNVVWEDVTQTIEQELVKNEAAAVQSLSQ